MLFLSGTFSWLSHWYKYIVRALPADTNTHRQNRLHTWGCFFLTYPWETDAHRGRSGCGLLVSTDWRQSRFVWTDKRGVDQDMCFSSSRGCIYLKKSVTGGDTGFLVQREYNFSEGNKGLQTARSNIYLTILSFPVSPLNFWHSMTH